ncbi:MAG: hypothetical protein LBK98_07055, partial [Peptococcaceae bacterium]|nr:hypothetical protein [Peptococcaceae bacterium]
MAEFLPVSKEEIDRLGWERADFVLVSGDSYVDHPSFGMAIISRLLSSLGYRVAILAQPEFRHCEDFRRFGRPRYAFLVTGGNIDSMVAHYTAARKRRSDDAYTAGNRAGRRPDRAATVYSRLAKEAYPDCPVILGGLEASLRRFAHYDYWDDGVRPSVLWESGGDILIYGMGERQITDVAAALAGGGGLATARKIPGVCWLARREEIFPAGGDGIGSEGGGAGSGDGDSAGRGAGSEDDSGAGDEAAGGAGYGRLPVGYRLCPSWDRVKTDKKAYALAARLQIAEQDHIRGRGLIQEQSEGVFLVQNPPAAPLEQRELDRVFALPYARM